MRKKIKSLHNIVIEGCHINTQLQYNSNTDHIGIGTSFQYRKEYQKKYYEDNKDKLNKQHKQYYKDNIDKIKQYYEDNKNKKKKYYEDNKNKINKKVQQYQKDNRNKLNEYNKQYRELHRDPNTPRKGSLEHSINKSCIHQQIPISEFKGFLTDQKYCKLFSEKFKEIIRNRFHRKCYLCNNPEGNRKLSVHHVNYNKQCLCQKTCEFVPLCGSCHIKTNFKRKYYEDLIMNYLYPERYFMVDL